MASYAPFIGLRYSFARKRNRFTSVIAMGWGFPVSPLQHAIDDLEAFQVDVATLQRRRDAIVRTLTRFNGHRQRTAQALGIGVRTLGLKLKKWKQMQLVDAGL